MVPVPTAAVPFIGGVELEARGICPNAAASWAAVPFATLVILKVAMFSGTLTMNWVRSSVASDVQTTGFGSGGLA